MGKKSGKIGVVKNTAQIKMIKAAATKGSKGNPLLNPETKVEKTKTQTAKETQRFLKQGKPATSKTSPSWNTLSKIQKSSTGKK